MGELKDKLITIEGLQYFKSAYVPSKTSELENDSNFITKNDIEVLATQEWVAAQLAALKAELQK